MNVMASLHKQIQLNLNLSDKIVLHNGSFEAHN